MAALQVNLANYKPPASVGNIALPTTSSPQSTYVNSGMSALNLSGVGQPATSGVTNRNVLPPRLGGPVPSSPSATGTAPTTITPPQNTSLKTPAAQQFISSQIPNASLSDQLAAIKQQALGIQAKIPGATDTGTPPTDSTSGFTTPNPDGTPPVQTPTQPDSTYQDALSKYVDSLNASSSLNTEIGQKQIAARRDYQNILDTPGGLTSGAQQAATGADRRNNAELADLAVQQDASTGAQNAALARLTYEKGLLPSTDNFNLSPGATEYDSKGNVIASAPDIAKTVGTPQTGIYTQNADGSYTQTLAPVGGDSVQSLAQELITGNLAPSDLSKRSTGVGSYSDILKAANDLSVQQIGKPFDIAKANTDYKFANNPNTQNTLNYLGSLVGSADGSTPGNLDQLVTLSKQVAEPKGFLGIGQTDFPALNNTIQWAKLSSGDPQIASYYSTLLEVSDQVAKVLQGGGSGGTSDAKLAQAQSLFQKGFTKDQVAAVAGSLKGLLANRASSMIKDNPYLSSYASQFGITQNNNKGTGSSSTGNGGIYDF